MLHGQRLCIYLDPSREWPPSLEMGGGRAEDVAQGAERLWREGHSTLDRYRYAIGPHIKPAVGRMKLTPAHVHGF